MNRMDVQRWLDRYVEAWRANQPGPIEELFTDDATYGYRPWDSDEHTVRGRDAIVASWLEEPDDPGSWEAHYEPYAVEGDRAVAVGWSRYAAAGDRPQQTYHNGYLLQFAPDGRCSKFNEFYMEEGK
ncbi:MAG TPA: nuclear transport factor 2 family protein [Candidatus Limnocylindria bacterium]|nr:nuclear transport factor 2 family protein [Candidatus Limnocylindria bacterium]HEU4862685.1 nuclear transport factor 2 family protein [Candidatus Limnocylindria bacterium]